MLDSVDIPNLPGYVSVKEAADILGISDKRVYQYVMSGLSWLLRLPVPKQAYRSSLSPSLLLSTTLDLLKVRRFLKRMTQVVRTTVSAILQNSTGFSWEKEISF